MTSDAAPEASRLPHNLVLFGRLLRQLGLGNTPNQTRDVLAALEHLDLSQKRDLQVAARAILIGRRSHMEIFDRAFEAFWHWRHAENPGWVEVESPACNKHGSSPGDLTLIARTRSNSSHSPLIEEPVIERCFAYSATEILRHKDFGELNSDEVYDIKQLIREMDWELESRRTRRRSPRRGGDRLDLRRVLRRSLKTGGEPLELSWRRRRSKPRPLVALCDISGSMEHYSRMLLHFLYALSQGLHGVEVFLFGTRLTHVTRCLRERDPERALALASTAVPDWAGGTRIGKALRTFNYFWGRRVLGQGAIVLLISDGWDRGEVDLLEREMARLRRSCHRLVWLNPLLGMPGFEPLTRGLEAALPFVDDFLPVHNLESLEHLATLLKGVGQHKTRRPSAANL